MADERLQSRNRDIDGFIKLHTACPCGMSSDAYSINADGSGYCFSCSDYFPSKDRGSKIETGKVETLRYLPQRGISERTIQFYDIKTKLLDDEPFEVGFPYPSGGFKVRTLAEKKFRTEGPMKNPGLFGKDKFDPGSKDSITICEGEWDAASVYEATLFRTAGVSVSSAGMAKRDCVADRDYINSFKKIIICFDNDDAGKRAAKEVSSMFDFNKVYHVRFTKYKDANEYFLNQEVNELQKMIANAKRYSPDNIISSFKDIEQSLIDSKEDEIGTYPFQSLQTSTYGLHRGEVVVIKGPTGIGKTEVFRALEHHLLKTTKCKIGILHMEEDNGTTVKAIAGYEINQPATLPDCGLSRADILEGYKQAVGYDDSRVHLYQAFDVEDEEAFIDNLRFLVSGAGCDFIFLDHITWLATGLKMEDERIKLDRISQKLKLLAKELRFCLIIISHTNDEGRTRGSRNIENVANTMIHLTRDKTHIDPTVKRIMSFDIEKVRLGGHAGPAGKAIMDDLTMKLRPLTVEDEIKIPHLRG